MVNRQGTESNSGGFFVQSAVIGVCAGLMSASVRIRQKNVSRSQFVTVVARSCLGADHPCRVSRQMSMWIVHCRTRMRCLLPDGRVARTSLRFRYNFWISRNGIWRRTVVSSARKTSWSLRHVGYAESNYPLGRFLILFTTLHWCCRSAKDVQKHLYCLQSCLGSLFRAGFVLAF